MCQRLGLSLESVASQKVEQLQLDSQPCRAEIDITFIPGTRILLGLV